MSNRLSDVEIDAEVDIRQALEALKRVSPRLATEARKALRESGKAIIEEQGRILDSEKGGAVTRTNYRMRVGLRRGGYRRGPQVALYGGQVIDSVEARESTPYESRGTRRAIKAGLKTRVRTPRNANALVSARVVSEGRRPMNKAFNMHKFRREPSEGRYVEQAGTRYFQRGISEKYQYVREELFRAVEDMTANIH